jgi:FAD/FMN-containing dehydrogenase
MTAIDTGSRVDKLSARIRGDVVASGDASWDQARQAYNTTIDQQPELIAFPETEADVASIVTFARENGLRVAPQRTGHNAAPLGSLEDTLLLKTDRLQGVELDVANLSARVRAGVKWENVVPQASDLGVAALHGSTPDVSIVGYSLGGGLGWYARKHGLAANSVTAIELVTADGRLVRTDLEHEPELFWALRGGGGGNFGVVTALEFKLLPISQVYAGLLFYPFEQTGEVLHAWHEWTKDVPDEMTSVGRVLQFPPLPEVPEPFRGNSYAIFEAIWIGDEADGIELTNPMRELGPIMDTFATVPPVGIAELHMDPPDPVPYALGHLMLGDLPGKAIDDFAAVTGPGSTLAMAELRHLGGALGRSAPHHGAIDKLDGSFAMLGIGFAPTAEAMTVAEEELRLLEATMRPYESGLYWNFTEEQVATSRFFSDEKTRRLQAVKAQWDPDNVFKANHAITPEQ